MALGPARSTIGNPSALPIVQQDAAKYGASAQLASWPAATTCQMSETPEVPQIWRDASSRCGYRQSQGVAATLNGRPALLASLYFAMKRSISRSTETLMVSGSS